MYFMNDRLSARLKTDAHDFFQLTCIADRYSLQGLPSQRATSNSSILACLNVIKTTSLIISCTKHLHNSFCIHFDAFWCILMHSEHLQKEMVNFNQKKNEFFQITISCTKLKNYSFCKHIAAFCCILMHSDAFWCIQMHFDAFYHNPM